MEKAVCVRDEVVNQGSVSGSTKLWRKLSAGKSTRWFEIWCVFLFQILASSAWFSPSYSNLCPSPESRQLSCRHLMICLQLCQQSACRAGAYHHSSRLCMLSGSELLSPCARPGDKTFISPGQDIESTHLTDATNTVEVTEPAPPPLLDTGGFDHLPLVWWDIISPP